MHLFFSGGGSPWIAEMQLKRPAVMLSYWVNVGKAKHKPDGRLRKLLVVRKAKKMKKGG